LRPPVLEIIPGGLNTALTNPDWNSWLTSLIHSLTFPPSFKGDRHKRNPHQVKQRRGLKDREKGKKKETERQTDGKKTKGDVSKTQQEKERA
jgi:hypothetical protein